MIPTNPTSTSAWQAPSLAEVAEAFPQLEILELLGQGGMGCVFKARQPKLDRLMALKLLPMSLAEKDATFAGRFEREGKLLAKLHHPNIVTVHDSGTAGEFFFLLMEYVEGVTLRQAMRTERFTPMQALAIVPLICEALQFAHDEGVLHRDIKPENILLDRRGRVKLVDFGIGKLLGDMEDTPAGEMAGSEPELTQSGASLGTPSYMAPEQKSQPETVDHRADIYSLGVVFYELLTGELPVGRFAPPSEKCQTDPRVDAIVAQALDHERNRRQSSATELKTQVETVSANPKPKSERRSRQVALPDDGFFTPQCVWGALAVIFSIVGGWMHIERENVHNTVWHVGLFQPIMGEYSHITEAGIFRQVNLLGAPYAVASIAMLAAIVCWFTWFRLKRQRNQALDSLLRCGTAATFPLRAILLGIGAVTFAQWGISLTLVLYGAVFGKGIVQLSFPFMLIHIIAWIIGLMWLVLRLLGKVLPDAGRSFRDDGRVPYLFVKFIVFAAILTILLAAGRWLFPKYGRQKLVPTNTLEGGPKAPPKVVGNSSPEPSANIPAETDLHCTVKKTSKPGGQEAELRVLTIHAKRPGHVHVAFGGEASIHFPLEADTQDPGGFIAHFTYGVSQNLPPVSGPSLRWRARKWERLEDLDNKFEIGTEDPVYPYVLSNFSSMSDPAGVCWRNVPLDVAHFGDGALTVTITDTEKPAPEPTLFFYAWEPPDRTKPGSKPVVLQSWPVRIGQELSGRHGEQKIGRISQRNGHLATQITYQRGSTAYLNGPLELETPKMADYYSGNFIQFVGFVLSARQDIQSLLDKAEHQSFKLQLVQKYSQTTPGTHQESRSLKLTHQPPVGGMWLGGQYAHLWLSGEKVVTMRLHQDIEGKGHNHASIYFTLIKQNPPTFHYSVTGEKNQSKNNLVDVTALGLTAEALTKAFRELPDADQELVMDTPLALLRCGAATLYLVVSEKEEPPKAPGQ